MTNLFTVVLGVDKVHLQQLELVLPTWQKHKPDLFSFPMLIFYDWKEIHPYDIRCVLQLYKKDIKLVPWPPKGVEYIGGKSKWESAVRARMLSGFVYVPAEHVKTKYWMKIDTDVVALTDCKWYEDKWFDSDYMIIGHPWGYTRPPNLMLQLDEWVKKNSDKLPKLGMSKPLNLVPKPGHVKLRHHRIASWVCFFNTEFTKECSKYAENTCGIGQMPCHSQDGFMFYVAKRLGYDILRENMKTLGWTHRDSMKNIRSKVEEIMR